NQQTGALVPPALTEEFHHRTVKEEVAGKGNGISAKDRGQLTQVIPRGNKRQPPRKGGIGQGHPFCAYQLAFAAVQQRKGQGFDGKERDKAEVESGEIHELCMRMDNGRQVSRGRRSALRKSRWICGRALRCAAEPPIAEDC